MSQVVELKFPVKGKSIPVDHGYALYGSLCRIIPELHSMVGVGVALVRGKYEGNSILHLNKLSAVRIRIPDNNISTFLPLSGKTVSVDDHKLTLGNPSVVQLKPRSAFYAHIVTTKNGNDEQRFATAIREQLNSLGIQGQFAIGKRKTFKVSDKQIVGYSLLVTGLTAEESIILQESGLGGRRKMGCGIFLGIR